MIYLDNAATTYPKPEEVYRALDKANREFAFNAGRGSYPAAKKTFNMIQQTRQSLADLIHVSPDTVSFESSATEALNVIIHGLDFKDGDTVYISPFEHNAVVRPLYCVREERKINIEILPFNKVTWDIDTERMRDMFAIHKPAAVFVSHISNVTGYILPYQEIFGISSMYGAVNVLDCSQSLGVLNPNPENVDFIIFAGHKSLYSSFGAAGFYNLKNRILKVIKSGGTGSDSLNHSMPEKGSQRYEAGSINSVAIAGIKSALEWLYNKDIKQHEAALTAYVITELRKHDKVHLYLPEDTSRVIGIVSMNVEGYSPADVGTILAEDYDICVRTGYHCSPFVHKFIGSLDSMGTVRISMGAFNTKEDIDKLVAALSTL
jgi:cysteine desulfurase family protein